MLRGTTGKWWAIGFWIFVGFYAANAFGESPGEITNDYRAYLGRYPGSTEINYWVWYGSIYGAGAVAHGIAASGEAVAATAQIQEYYRLSLGRYPSQTEVSNFLFYVVSVAGWGAAQNQIAASPEAAWATSIVQTYYRTYLGRMPGAGEVPWHLYWVVSVSGWAADQNLIATSAEAAAVASTLTFYFRYFLGRPPFNAGEIYNWLYWIIAPQGWGSGINTLATTGEAYAASTTIQTWYRAYLGRSAAPAEQAWHLYYIVSFQGWYADWKMIATSAEATNAFAIIRDYYRMYLGRNPSQGEVSNWLYNGVSVSGWYATQSAIAASGEAQNATAMMQAYFQQYLGRGATPAEVQWWLANSVADLGWAATAQTLQNIGQPPAATANATPNGVYTCAQLGVNFAGYSGTGADASGALQACINQAPVGAQISLDPGQYVIDVQVTVPANRKIYSAGAAVGDTPCNFQGDARCPRLIEGVDIVKPGGMILVAGNDVAFDHIIFDGNRDARLTNPAVVALCGANSDPATLWQFTLHALNVDGLTMTNSVFTNTACQVGFSHSGNRHTIKNNSIVYNGRHDQSFRWVCGEAFWGGDQLTLVQNYFLDNTDGDIQIGYATNSKIQSNTFSHPDGFTWATHGALLLGQWAGAGNANFTGTDVSYNNIQCGPLDGANGQWGCGIGLGIGQTVWGASQPVYGASIHDNQISNALIGVSIYDAYGITLYNNVVTGSGAAGKWGCVSTPAGTKIPSMAYQVGPNSSDFAGLGIQRLTDTPGDQLSNYVFNTDLAGVPDYAWAAGQGASCVNE